LRSRPLRPDHILNGHRSISAETAVRLGRYFCKGALQSQHDIAVVERERGEEIAQPCGRQGGVKETGTTWATCCSS
jgi:plasmid maintenance system antidote protein VapI